jgi:chromatin structure-remodeling complex subunit RSC3/30
MSAKRRNGLLSSCEPCRLSKLRCDHRTPVCGRCLQKGQSNACNYHPAPLTRSKIFDSLEPIRTRKKSKRPSIFRERGKKLANLRQVYRISAASDPEQTTPSQYDNPAQNHASIFAGGFFGPSNCLAAFEEPEHNCNSSTNVCVKTETLPVDSDQIESGARIVALLEDLPIYHRLLDFRYTTCKPWVFSQRLSNEVIMPLYALRDELHQLSSKADKSLRKKAFSLSRKLFENTANPVETRRNMTPSEYFSLTARRWETIGLMFSWLASAMMLIPDEHEYLQLKDGLIDKHELKNVAVEAAETCLAFCDDVGAMTDPLSWLLLRNTLMLDAVYGHSRKVPYSQLFILAGF